MVALVPVNNYLMTAVDHGPLTYCTYLSGGVEDVEPADLSVDDGLLPVAVFDVGVVLLDEVVADKLDGEGRLPHAPVAQHDHLVLGHLRGQELICYLLCVEDIFVWQPLATDCV